MKPFHSITRPCAAITRSALGLAALLLSAAPAHANTPVGDWSFTSTLSGWTSWRTTTLTGAGVQLGTVGVGEGGIFNSGSGLTATNCGVEMIYTASNEGGGYRTYLRMYNGSESVGLATVGGNIFLNGWGDNFNPPSWSVGASGLVNGVKHSLALVLLDDGTLSAYLDGSLLASRADGKLFPASALTSVGVGNEISGGWYIPKGTLVERVRTFTFDTGAFNAGDLLLPAAAGAVDAATSTVSASPSAVAADGSGAATITVTLKDALGNAVPGKGVSLAHTSGPGTPVITPVSGTTSAAGIATFAVTSVTIGEDVFTATDTTDEPNVAVIQTATVNFTAYNVGFAETSLNPSTGTEIANNGTVIRAYHFGSPGTSDATVNGVTFLNGGYPDGGGITDTAMSGSWYGETGWAGWTNGSFGSDPDYNLLMKSMIAATGTTPNGGHITIGGLTIGHTYRLQLISNASRLAKVTVEGESHTMIHNEAPALVSAQWVATDDTLNAEWANGNTTPHFCGYVLHDLSGGTPVGDLRRMGRSRRRNLTGICR